MGKELSVTFKEGQEISIWDNTVQPSKRIVAKVSKISDYNSKFYSIHLDNGFAISVPK